MSPWSCNFRRRKSSDISWFGMKGWIRYLRPRIEAAFPFHHAHFIVTWRIINSFARISNTVVFNNNPVSNWVLVVQQGVILIAQKIVSKSENRYVDLKNINPSQKATDIAKQLKKDPRLVQTILDESKKIRYSCYH